MDAVTPPVRSSDYGLSANPFLYLMRRRFGVVPIFDYSEALSRGSWWHQAAELMHLPPDEADALFTTAWQDREDELLDACEARGGVKPDKFLERERHDYLTARAWFDAALQIPLKDNAGQTFDNWHTYLEGKHLRIVGTEITIRTHDSAIMCDALMLDDEDRLWIVDYKTTSSSATDRLATCPDEFQTLLYTNVLAESIGAVRRFFGLPPRASVGGMIHVAIQKPGIKFGREDRDCLEYDHELKSGPRKGQIERRREYAGDPRIENYVGRCRDWMLGQNQYLHFAEERAADPCINISWTPHRVVEQRDNWYYLMRERIEKLRDRKPVKELFPPGASEFNNRRSPYLPFQVLNPEYWSAIMAEDGFVVRHRDEHPGPDRDEIRISCAGETQTIGADQNG